MIILIPDPYKVVVVWDYTDSNIKLYPVRNRIRHRHEHSKFKAETPGARERGKMSGIGAPSAAKE